MVFTLVGGSSLLSPPVSLRFKSADGDTRAELSLSVPCDWFGTIVGLNPGGWARPEGFFFPAASLVVSSSGFFFPGQAVYAFDAGSGASSGAGGLAAAAVFAVVASGGLMLCCSLWSSRSWIEIQKQSQAKIAYNVLFATSDHQAIRDSKIVAAVKAFPHWCLLRCSMLIGRSQSFWLLWPMGWSTQHAHRSKPQCERAFKLDWFGPGKPPPEPLKPARLF